MRTPKIVPIFYAIIALWGMPRELTAQELIRNWGLHGLKADHLALLPDSDGDGLPEFLLGWHDYDPPTPQVQYPGMAYVIRTSDGAVVNKRIGAVNFLSLGVGVGSVGDVDGDGTGDYATSGLLFPTGSFPQLQVFSGKDDKVLFERSSPAIGILPLGKLGADGEGDFLLGDFQHGVLSLIHGGTFELKHEWHSTGGALGMSIAALGDIDGDGFVDIAAGAPGGGVPGGNWPGKVQVFSGRDYRLLFEQVGEGVTEMFGWKVAAPGDLNGDGFGDLVVAGPGCCTQWSETDGPGRLYFYDVRNDVLIGTVNPDVSRSEQGFGLFMATAGDVDGDGVGDVFASSDYAPTTTIYLDVIDGATRRRILRMVGSSEGWPAVATIGTATPSPTSPC